MEALFYFVAFLYGTVGVGTAVYVLTKAKSNPAAALLAGMFWPLFWITGQAARNRRLPPSDDRRLPW